MCYLEFLLRVTILECCAVVDPVLVGPVHLRSFNVAIDRSRGPIEFSRCSCFQPRSTNVGLIEIIDKQEEVANIHQQSPFHVVLRNMTRKPIVQQPIGIAIDEETDHHLGQLEYSYSHHHWSRNAYAHRTQGVVGVHEGVNNQVHNRKPPTRSSVVAVGVPTVQQDRDMMKVMQKY